MTTSSGHITLKLLPESAWSKVADDDTNEIWLTTDSLIETARSEAAFQVKHCTGKAVLDALQRTDHAAFVSIDKQNDRILIECRPRTGERLYVSRQCDNVEVSAGIAHLSALARTAPLSRHFLAVWLANALNFGGFDLFLGRSPFEDSYLIARGLRLMLLPYKERWTLSTIEDAMDPDLAIADSLTKLVEDCRTAVSESILIGTSNSNVISECSGGIDSGVTTVLANRLIGTRFRGAAFADYPFYEFRQERLYSQAILNRENITLLDTDHKLWVRWGGLGREHQQGPYLEPSLHIPYWGQALATMKHATREQNTTILTGQGGDSLFQTRTLAPYFPERPAWLPKPYWEMILHETEQIRNLTDSPMFSCCGYGYDNPWMSRALGKTFPGTVYHSPLASRASIQSFNKLRRCLNDTSSSWDSRDDIQKPLAYAAFRDLLPERVWTRRWKVNYVGLYYRSWFKAGDELLSLTERVSPVLEALGLSPFAFIRGVKEMAKGKKSSDRLMNALVTYLVWVHFFFNSNADSSATSVSQE